MALTKLSNTSINAITAAGLPTLISGKMPSGSVLQIVSDDVTSAGDFNGTSWADRISVNITTKAANSNILAIYTAGDCRITGHTATYGATRILRDGNTLQDLCREVGRGQDPLWFSMAFSHQAAVSGLGTTYTYKIQHRNVTGNGQFRVGDSGMPSRLTLFEIVV